LETREQQLEFGFGQLGVQLARVRNERAASGIGPAERASWKKGKRERVGSGMRDCSRLDRNFVTSGDPWVWLVRSSIAAPTARKSGFGRNEGQPEGPLGFGNDSVRGETPGGETGGDVFGIEDEAR
jgi:hypothetical protein